MCILGSNVLNQRTQASLSSAYAIVDQSYRDYRNKVKELYGEETDNRIIEAIAVDKAKHIYINASYLDGPCDSSLEEESSGKPVLWYEEYSKRFFRASLEQVLAAEYHVNRNYILGGLNVLNDLYSLLGLEETDFGEEMGWAPTDEGSSGLNLITEKLNWMMVRSFIFWKCHSNRESIMMIITNSRKSQLL